MKKGAAEIFFDFFLMGMIGRERIALAIGFFICQLVW
jgi:hypothetical protein